MLMWPSKQSQIIIVTLVTPADTFLCLTGRMPDAKALAKGRKEAVKRARAVSKLQELLRETSPSLACSRSSHSALDFHESDTPMAPLSEDDGDDSPAVPP